MDVSEHLASLLANKKSFSDLTGGCGCSDEKIARFAFECGRVVRGVSELKKLCDNAGKSAMWTERMLRNDLVRGFVTAGKVKGANIALQCVEMIDSTRHYEEPLNTERALLRVSIPYLKSRVDIAVFASHLQSDYAITAFAIAVGAKSVVAPIKKMMKSRDKKREAAENEERYLIALDEGRDEPY